MCGIFGIFDINPNTDKEEIKTLGLKLANNQVHRGPDELGVYQDNNTLLIHQRLSIVDVKHGHQPIISENNNIVCIANGEIYNYKEFEKNIREEFKHRDGNIGKRTTRSDCEVFNLIYEACHFEPATESYPHFYASTYLNKLNGIFSFIVYHKESHYFMIGRDPIGVCPLYWGTDHKGQLYVASEMKAIQEMCDDVSEFPPGYFYHSKMGMVHYFKEKDHRPTWENYFSVKIMWNAIDEYNTDLYVFYDNFFKKKSNTDLEFKETFLIKKEKMEAFRKKRNDTGYEEDEFEEDYYHITQNKSVKVNVQNNECVIDGKFEAITFDNALSLDNFKMLKLNDIFNLDRCEKILRKQFEDAIQRQLMSEVPFGVLLSGGLDSSLVAYCVSQLSETPIHTFSIGLQDSPDLKYAEQVSKAIGSIHHSFIYTIEEGIQALPDVIKHIETYDVTSIRASTPMYLMGKKIKELGFKMVLSGEGSDEIFGGYLYFHKAPNAIEFHEETVRKIFNLHYYDCLRANKSMMASGVEARVPFLDLQFLDFAMSINPEWKMIKDGKMEKQILRDAFKGALPDNILYRQKEQFSDGVGYGWIDNLKAYSNEKVSDDMLLFAKQRFPHNTPSTKEAYYYRDLFEQCYPTEACARTVPGGKSIACSTATALAWDENFAKMADPSGRAVKNVHLDAVVNI
jgi:asparagine synthetase B (glutamine-hydrolysing)